MEYSAIRFNTEFSNRRSMRQLRYVIATTLIIFAAATGSSFAQPSDYPTRPIRIIVTAAPGGELDVLARLFASHLATTLKQTTHVENKGGAAGLLAAQTVARAEPDGYTILFSSQNIAAFKATVSAPQFEPLRDLALISTVMDGPFAIAVPADRPFKTFPELVAYTKTGLDIASYASFSAVQWMSTASWMMPFGIKARNIPYRTSLQAATGVAMGEVDFLSTSTTAIQSFVDSGKVRYVGVTSPKRLSAWPEVPSIFEFADKPLQISRAWFGVAAPKETPENAIKVLHAAVLEFVELPVVRERFERQGLQAYTLSPTEFTARVERDEDFFVEMAAKLGIEKQ